MNIYIESQMKEIYLQGWYDGKIDVQNKQEEAISFQKPIKLPSVDEAIIHLSKLNKNVIEFDNGFILGVKWMKEQIINNKNK